MTREASPTNSWRFRFPFEAAANPDKDRMRMKDPATDATNAKSIQIHEQESQHTIFEAAKSQLWKMLTLGTKNSDT